MMFEEQLRAMVLFADSIFHASEPALHCIECGGPMKEEYQDEEDCKSWRCLKCGYLEYE